MEEGSLSPPRPTRALRVGFTGARIEGAGLEALRPALAEILAFTRDEASILFNDARADAYYEQGAPTLRFLSSLAIGADRLAAEEALKAGFQLFAPLPFPVAEYEKDFPQSVGAFRELLAKGQVLELDGRPDFFREESYREAGHFILRNCDLLIAIWDGNPARGPGGTGEIVRAAALAHLPVWWIDTRAGAVRFVEEPSDLRVGPEEKTRSKARLAHYLERMISPPPSHYPPREGAFGAAAGSLERIARKKQGPLDVYLAEAAPRYRLIFWRAYAWLMSPFASENSGDENEPQPPAAFAETYWKRFYAAADHLAIDYADRYRSSYVWIAVFAAFALAGSAASAIFPSNERTLVIIELALLAMIGALVFVNIYSRWHEKWISYRLVAELCRKQSMLSSLGRSLPRPELFRVSYDYVAEDVDASDDESPAGDLWVAWYFSAAQRAAPLPAGSLATMKPAAQKMLLDLCERQIVYHAARRRQNEKASDAMSFWGQFCFGLTFVFAITKFFSVIAESHAATALSGALGTALSGGSAALVGIRSYSEFSLLVRRSTVMLQVLKDTQGESSAIDVDEPLASTELGGLMDGLAHSMMQDESGWAELFRVKGIEVG